MIAVIDYGVGNLFSLLSSLNSIGADAKIVRTPEALVEASHIILPGVGAFEDAARKLKESGMREQLLIEAYNDKPLLGICLGMQLLFERSYEFGTHEGLALLSGTVEPFSEDFARLGLNLKVPHIGWNSLSFVKESPLLKYSNEGDFVYYVHSYHAKNCADSLIATSEYGVDVTGMVGKGNILGTQFHPEKSGDVGLNILKAFCEVR